MLSYEQITLSVVKIAQKAAAFIRKNKGRLEVHDIEEKGLHDMVSYVDKQSEQLIINGLSILLPDAGFIAEESGTSLKGNLNWIIDPLDGTTNFVHGLPLFSISIALMEEGNIVSAVVLEVNSKECFYAWKDSQAFCNGKVIHVSKAKWLNQSLLATGFPYNDFSRMTAYLQLFNELMQQTRGIRRLGSAALDLAYVACGRFELFYEYGLHPWDVAAGALIVERAGGKITDFNGDPDGIFGKDIIASNSLVHNEMLDKTKKYFKVIPVKE